MARNPEKLRELLQQRQVPESTIADSLVVITGSVTDTGAVKDTLLYKNLPVDFIISGIGGRPSFENALQPSLDNPTICQNAIRSILTVAPQEPLMSDSKPLLIVISTTGISQYGRDVPLIMLPLYHWALKVPHRDKAGMELLIREEMVKPIEKRGIQSCTVVRPSLLTNGEGGLEDVRVGLEETPAVGYTISRSQVGRWIFENLLSRHSEYVGKVVAITS